MCWEKSLIPLAIWQAGARHSNLIESLHADSNREGTGCTLVGGIKKALYFDAQRQSTLAVCYWSVKVALSDPVCGRFLKTLELDPPTSPGLRVNVC